MSYGEHGYVVLRSGLLGRHRPPEMAVQLDAEGQIHPVPELGGMDEVQGYLTWRLYLGDTIGIFLPEEIHETGRFAADPPPQGDWRDAKDRLGRRLPRPTS